MPTTIIHVINNQPISEVVLFNHIPDAHGILQKIKVRGLWDTGARMTTITERLAQSLNLQFSRLATPNGVGGNGQQANIYWGCINVDGINYGVMEMIAALVEDVDNTRLFDIMIGMDIISVGELHVKDDVMTFIH